MSGKSIIGKSNRELKQIQKPKFSGYSLPHKEVAEKKIRGYKIFKNSKEFVIVEAYTAAEAIEKSGLTNPAKMVRLGTSLGNILSENVFDSKILEQNNNNKPPQS